MEIQNVTDKQLALLLLNERHLVRFLNLIQRASWLYSFPSGKWWNSILEHATTDSSGSVIKNPPIIQCHKIYEAVRKHR